MFLKKLVISIFLTFTFISDAQEIDTLSNRLKPKVIKTTTEWKREMAMSLSISNYRKQQLGGAFYLQSKQEPYNAILSTLSWTEHEYAQKIITELFTQLIHNKCQSVSMYDSVYKKMKKIIEKIDNFALTFRFALDPSTKKLNKRWSTVTLQLPSTIPKALIEKKQHDYKPIPKEFAVKISDNWINLEPTTHEGSLRLFI